MLPRFFINRPIFAWVIALSILLAGALVFPKLPVSQYPDVAPPALQITAIYPGASAQVVEDTVTALVEQEMNGLEHLLYMDSNSDASGTMTLTLTFESGSALKSGERRLQYLETIEGRAGTRGQIDIPSIIKIQVPVWRGVAIAVPMTARFRYRIGREGLRLAYVLDQLDDVLDAAWTSLLGELTDTLPVPVLAGRAPSYAG